MKILAMIPARLGSQRLKKKNLADFHGAPLIAHAVRKCQSVSDFDSVWINSESEVFREIAENEGAFFHQRPEHMGNNDATSEQFVAEFLRNHACDFVVQVHSIAPLLSGGEIQNFVEKLKQNEVDTLFSVVNETLECLYAGEPVNFSWSEKTNSQDLEPVQRIVWAISAWRRETYLAAFEAEACATYSGRIGYIPVSRMAGHVIKVQEDLDMARALYPVIAK